MIFGYQDVWLAPRSLFNAVSFDLNPRTFGDKLPTDARLRDQDIQRVVIFLARDQTAK